jgi:hypothetical protein
MQGQLKLPSFEWGIIDKLRRSEIARQAHNRARFIWARTSNWLLASIAVAGAFSGASAIADNELAAVILGIATAMLSGANAALQPADKAAQHRVAAVGYNEVLSGLERLLIDREVAGRLEWGELRPQVISIDKRLTRVEAEAPHVRPRKNEVAEAEGRIKLILGAEVESSA